MVLELTIDPELDRIKLPEPTSDIKHEIASLIDCMERGRFQVSMIDLLLDPDVLSTINQLTAYLSARYVLGVLFTLYHTHVIYGYRSGLRSNTTVATFASSYAKIMNHLYGALENSTKAQIHLYNIRTIEPAALHEDFASCVEPLPDLYEDIYQKLELARKEAVVLKTLIREVGILLIPSLLHDLI